MTSQSLLQASRSFVLSADTSIYPGVDDDEIVAQQFIQTLHPAIGPSRL